MRKEKRVRGMTISDIELYYEVIIIRTAWCCCRNTHRDQWNKLVSLEITQVSMVNLFNKWGRCIKCSQKTLFNKWAWESWAATCNTMKLDHQLTPNTKINSRWIKDLHRSCDIIKVLGENISKKI